MTRYLFIFLVVIFVFTYTNAKRDCEVEGIESMDFVTYYTNKLVIAEDYSGIVAEFPSTGITGVSIEKGTYLDIKIKDNKIIIETTDDFKNLEMDNAPINGPFDFSTNIIFECDNGVSNLNFIQKVTDINNHDPYFLKELYEYKYGMGLLQGFELTKSFDIIGLDDDLTWQQEKYEITGDLLKIDYCCASGSKKGSFAKVTLLKDIEAPFDEEFTLTVTDDGVEPFRSGTAKLRLTLTNEDSLVVSPLFSRPLWHWQYDVAKNIITHAEEVTFSRGFSEGLIIKQKNYEDFFEAKLMYVNEGLVEITLKNKLSEDLIKERRIFINLEAEVPGAKQIAKTSVLIEIN